MELSREPGIALQGMARISNQQEYIAADRAYLKLIDHPLNELLSSDWKSTIPAQDIPRAVHAFQDMQLSGIGEFHGHMTTRQGDEVPVRVLLIQNYNEEDVSAGHYCFIQARHTLRSGSAGLLQGYELFRAALGHALIGSVLLDPVSGFRRVNEALLAMLGYAGPELSGRNFADITDLEGFDRDANLAYMVWKGDLPGCQFQRQIQRKDGESFSAGVYVRIIRDKRNDPVYAIGFIREHYEARQREDFTHRANRIQRNTEKLLKLSEERYQAIAEQGWEGIALVDPVSKKILEATSPFLLLTGYTRLEIASLSLYDLTARDPAIVDNDMGHALASKSRVIGEWPFRRKDGRMVDLEVSTNTVYYGGGLVVRLVARDIGERKVLEEQLRHSAQMEALGRFAGGIAHDFNNMLVGILGYSTLLEGKLHRDPTLSKLGHEITSAALKARQLTSQLLSISRRQVLPAELLDINIVVRGAESLLQRILGEDIELHSELNPLTARVRANPGQIEQVIINLAANSRDAMPKGGKLIIETNEILVDEVLAFRKPGLIVGKYVLLSIRDTGFGMDSVTLSHLFEPFYTTKDAGVGTGLGLSAVYGIVKQIGGLIAVESQVNVGTTFEIYFPRIEEQHSLFQPGEAKAYHAAVSTTVLVVEDETTVRSLVMDILEAEGYKVLSAEDAEQALILAKSYDGPIHLVVTDVVMPSMSGSELAAELLHLRPDTRIIFISGYSDTEIVRRTQSGAPANFVSKPFTPEELQRKVREVLKDSSIDLPPEN